jgi:hypothetical protein
MAYLAPDFQHDLFISYSHGDFDHTGSSPLKEWSEEWVSALSYELQWNKEFKTTLNIFRDEDHRPDRGLDPTAPLTDELRSRIKQSALLAVLICEPYLGSRWCGEEFKAWQEAHGLESVRTQGRVFPIRVAPTVARDWPEALRDANGEPPVGFFFHDKAENDPNLGRPFKWKGSKTHDEKYQEALMALVTQVTLRLKDFKNALERQRQLAENARKLEDGGLVYLFSHQQDAGHWDRCNQALTMAGFAVLPDGPEEEAVDDLDWRRKERVRIDTLTGCDALLIVAGEHDDAIGRDLAAIGRHCRHAAKARSDKFLPCAVLDATGTGARGEAILRIARQLGIQWIDTTTGEDWIARLQAFLQASSEQFRRTA